MRNKSYLAAAVVVALLVTANGVNANVYPPTPTTTTTVAPSLDPIIPTTPPQQGNAFAIIGGVPFTVTVTPNAQSGSVTVSGPGFTLTCRVANTVSAPVAPAAPIGRTTPGGRRFAPPPPPPPPVVDSSLFLVQQGTFSTGGTGFLPGSEVRIWLLSSPVLLGTVRVDANGSFSTDLLIPGSIGAGRHTIQVNGLSPSGQLRSTSLGVQVVKTTTLTSTVLFDADSPAITLSALRTIERLAARVAALQPVNSSVQVLGYVQPVGSSSKDQVLSARRARNVAKVLLGAGVQGAYDVRGLGAAKGTSPRARRVEITVVVWS